MLKIKSFKKLLVIMITLGFVAIGGTSLLVLKAIAQTPEKTATSAVEGTETTVEVAPNQARDSDTIKFGFIAAALAVGIGSIGAAIAVGNIGTAAMGTIGEKPE
ncbi:MAG TPA: ATP synthase subunit C, partial [Candidatus Marinimicrobia bacterium]|nr:ATP synthase subunit C [Candidatus Neomarinimicrobiota bacterium]